MLRRIGDFFDERTGWRQGARAWLDRPVAGGAGWALAMGAAVATCFGVLALTGVALMTAYAPSPQSAWPSVHYVQFVQHRGWIVRGLHHWAAQSLIVLAALHVAHIGLSGAHRKPREIAWWLSLAMLGVAIGGCITGGLLPWDQRGWWARHVEANIVGLAPAVGPWLQQMVQGGPEMGALGLSRAYAVHVVVLPALMLLALCARGALIRKHGWIDAGGASAPYFRRQLSRNVVAALFVVCALFALTGYTRGAPLDAPADPMSDYAARPEWFVLPLFQLRKFFRGSGEFWGTILVPLAAGAYLALLPWIDSGKRHRAIALAPLVLTFCGAVGLSIAAVRHDAHDAQFARARAKADARAAAAKTLALDGVPPDGPIAMLRRDPELRGRDLFDMHCASCHVMADLGDPEKATATKLDGWGTPDWIAAMIHDPDAPQFFGRGPYKAEMQSVDVRPPDKPAGEPWAPITKSDEEKRAVAAFLASEGDEPGDPRRDLPEAMRALGEKIVSDRCTGCHLYKGNGDDEGAGIAPELSRYGSMAWTRAQVANPATPATYRDSALDEKRKKHMPRFDKDLSADDIDTVARWTRAHARGLALR